jgi:hypothetical protein
MYEYISICYVHEYITYSVILIIRCINMYTKV